MTPYHCNTPACIEWQSPGCHGLCIYCWLKLSDAERDKRRMAAEIAEREQRKAVANG